MSLNIEKVTENIGTDFYSAGKNELFYWHLENGQSHQSGTPSVPRVRLATTLLLQAHGFQMPRYVSLERLVEESKEDYYAILADCSLGWHEGKNEIVPWLNYFLSVLRRAYREFERQVESTEARPAKSDLVRQTVLVQLEQFMLADLATQLPAASPQLIKKVLAELKNQGKIRLIGRGRGARWEIRIP